MLTLCIRAPCKIQAAPLSVSPNINNTVQSGWDGGCLGVTHWMRTLCCSSQSVSQGDILAHCGVKAKRLLSMCLNQNLELW